MNPKVNNTETKNKFKSKEQEKCIKDKLKRMLI